MPMEAEPLVGAKRSLTVSYAVTIAPSWAVAVPAQADPAITVAPATARARTATVRAAVRIMSRSSLLPCQQLFAYQTGEKSYELYP